jgi:hypothetical protein
MDSKHTHWSRRYRLAVVETGFIGIVWAADQLMRKNNLPLLFTHPVAWSGSHE